MKKTKWNLSEETKQKIASSKIGARNPMWKGNKAGYSAMHEWIKRRLQKPAVCDCCKQSPALDLANKSNKYLRDVSDWEWLCRRCHMTKDGRIKPFLDGREQRERVKSLNKKHSIRAKSVCGNGDYKRCRYCKQYDNMTNLVKVKGVANYYHKKCSSESWRALYEKRKLAAKRRET